jgi:hypothetical protein
VAGFSFSCVREAKAALGREGTGQVHSTNKLPGQGDVWWNGLGPSQHWTLRPAEGARHTRQSRQSGESGGSGPGPGGLSGPTRQSDPADPEGIFT